MLWVFLLVAGLLAAVLVVTVVTLIAVHTGRGEKQQQQQPQHTLSTSTPANSGWLGSLPDQDVVVADLLLPGTHDSATGCLELTPDCLPGSPGMGCSIAKDNTVANLAAAGGLSASQTATLSMLWAWLRKYLIAWTKTQTLDIPGQLRGGARWLDLRVRRGGSPSELYLHHGPVTLELTLAQVLEEVRAFLTDNPTEFVVVMVGHMDRTDSAFLNGYIQAHFPRGMCCPGSPASTTLREARGKAFFVLPGDELIAPAARWQDILTADSVIRTYLPRAMGAAVQPGRLRLVQAHIEYTEASILGPVFSEIFSDPSRLSETGIISESEEGKVNARVAGYLADAGQTRAVVLFDDFDPAVVMPAVVRLNGGGSGLQGQRERTLLPEVPPQDLSLPRARSCTEFVRCFREAILDGLLELVLTSPEYGVNGQPIKSAKLDIGIEMSKDVLPKNPVTPVIVKSQCYISCGAQKTAMCAAFPGTKASCEACQAADKIFHSGGCSGVCHEADAQQNQCQHTDSFCRGQCAHASSVGYSIHIDNIRGLDTLAVGDITCTTYEPLQGTRLYVEMRIPVTAADLQLSGSFEAAAIIVATGSALVHVPRFSAEVTLTLPFECVAQTGTYRIPKGDPRTGYTIGSLKLGGLNVRLNVTGGDASVVDQFLDGLTGAFESASNDLFARKLIPILRSNIDSQKETIAALIGGREIPLLPAMWCPRPLRFMAGGSATPGRPLLAGEAIADPAATLWALALTFDGRLVVYAKGGRTDWAPVRTLASGGAQLQVTGAGQLQLLGASGQRLWGTPPWTARSCTLQSGPARLLVNAKGPVLTQGNVMVWTPDAQWLDQVTIRDAGSRDAPKIIGRGPYSPSQGAMLAGSTVVTLTNVKSSAGCKIGENFRFTDDGRGLLMDRGCRGDFTVMSADGTTQAIGCDSDHNHKSVCAFPHGYRPPCPK